MGEALQTVFEARIIVSGSEDTRGSGDQLWDGHRTLRLCQIGSRTVMERNIGGNTGMISNRARQDGVLRFRICQSISHEGAP